MPTTTRDTSDTSVTFSLVELARLEDERVREEDERRARAREREAREQREAEMRRRAEEERRVAAQEEARAKRQREEAEAEARAKAREQAALEVARIEAAGRARLEAENAARAHELAVLKVRQESGRRRLQVALAVVIGLVACGGPAAAYVAHGRVTGLEQENAQLRESEAALAREHDQARTTELTALDRRFAALAARAVLVEDPRATDEASRTAEAARKALDAKALDHSRLRAFGDALDALQARIEGLERLAALERRHADLSAWADQRRRSEPLLAEARKAEARAKAMTDDGSLRAYEGALDRLRDALAKDGARGGAASSSTTQVTGPGGCTDPHDPMCGFGGQRLQ